MKLSSYIFTYPLNVNDDKIIFFNSFTNALALVERDKYQQFKAFAENGTPISDQKLIQDLIYGGFLLAHDFDELGEIERRILCGRFANNRLSLTIAPTMDCNFRCTYCYQRDIRSSLRMSEQTKEDIVNFVKQYAEKIRYLSITWYGGEPLLELNTIESLTRHLLEICKARHIHYTSGIITNGYLLTRDTIQRLNACGVRHYQITIDGDEKTHNQRRPYSDGSETFGRIIDHLTSNFDLLPEVFLRVNIDQNNLGAMESIHNILLKKGLRRKIIPYAGKITCDAQDKASAQNCLCDYTYGLLSLQFREKFGQTGEWIMHMPTVRANFCTADAMQAFIIHPDGSMYKCFNDIGRPEKAIGHIRQTTLSNHALLFDYLLYMPTKQKACKRCKCLPICVGGCPYQRQRQGVEMCSFYKTTMAEHIAFIAQAILCEQKGKCI